MAAGGGKIKDKMERSVGKDGEREEGRVKKKGRERRMMRWQEGWDEKRKEVSGEGRKEGERKGRRGDGGKEGRKKEKGREGQPEPPALARNEADQSLALSPCLLSH